MDHLIFGRVKIADKERRKGPGFPSKVNKDYGKHGLDIQTTLDNEIQKVKEKSAKFEFNPYLVLKIELEDNVQFTDDEEEKLELYGLKIIDKESNKLQVVFSQDIELNVFRDELLAYKNGEIAKTRVKNEDLFSKIKEISEWSKDDRLSFDINEIKKQKYIDVYLWVFDNEKNSKEAMAEFVSYVSENNAVVCDNYVGNSVVIARVRLNGDLDVVDKIVEHPLVYKVDLISKLNISMSSISDIKNISLDDIHFDNSLLDPDVSASICVIDSGIYAQHPLFRGVIGDSATFYLDREVEDDSNDISGHGTGVASICEYGDFEYNQSFEPQIYIHNAKIHNGQYDNIIDLWQREVRNQIGEFSDETIELIDRYYSNEIEFEEVIESFNSDEKPYVKMVYSKYAGMYEKLIPTQMREIVEYFYNTYGCKIYNLSQGDLDNVYSGDKPKAWACVLDELQNRYDILFVVSSGNYIYNQGKQFGNVLEEYPRYFFNREECRIIEPANSVTSITVGGIATSENVYNTMERVNKLPISKKGELASITRVGPGVGKSIKPDFIAYSGDIGVECNVLGRKNITENIGLSKLIFNNNINGLFTWDKGTSFAAPYISHLAACILNRYHDVSCNLIRAIIASSAVINDKLCVNNLNMKNEVEDALDEFKYRGKNNELIMKYFTCGYGFPNKEKCLESLDYRVVLLADIKDDGEALVPDNMHIFEIPLPNEFKKIKGKKRVIISLAFNPKVKNTRIDYMGVSMGFKLIKGKSIEEVIKIYESQKGKKIKKKLIVSMSAI